MSRYFVTGGAGFIGSNLVAAILRRPSGSSVTVFDNFSTGRRSHLAAFLDDPRLRIVEGSASDEGALGASMDGHDIVYHLASNSDIARATTDPAIDFLNGTVLTHNVLEAMRKTGVGRIVFVSGSGVYGEVPPTPIPENFSPLIPVSTYGACKLASEALISAYSFMFGIQATVFRLANVVGPWQTHGVGFDFVRRLSRDATRLRIYGDGTQSKPYIHVSDVISAMDLIEQSSRPGYDYYNVGSEDWLTVREIADIVVHAMGLESVEYEFTGGSRGWKADVPVYRLDTRKLRSQGWSNRLGSREAVTTAVADLINEARESIPHAGR